MVKGDSEKDAVVGWAYDATLVSCSGSRFSTDETQSRPPLQWAGKDAADLIQKMKAKYEKIVDFKRRQRESETDVL